MRHTQTADTASRWSCQALPLVHSEPKYVPVPPSGNRLVKGVDVPVQHGGEGSVVVSRVADGTLGCIYYLQLTGEGLLVVVSHDYSSSL